VALDKVSLNELASFQEQIDYSFNDEKLLIRALTHTSFANENDIPHYDNNQRLEFLGDAVLDLVVSEELFKKFPTYPEGDLTKIRAMVVCESKLAEKAKMINLGEHLLLGRGEEATGGRNRISVLADAFEALIGAIYLDGGYENARRFIRNHLIDDALKIGKEKDFKDYKTALQELVQSDYKQQLEYKVCREEGPDHAKVFYVSVNLDGKELGRGKGRSKKEAEQMAAKEALKHLL